MKFSPQICLLALITLIVISCKKENPSPNTTITGSEYFSSVVGMTRLYQVDSIYWDDFNNQHDTVSYQVKEVIPSTYLDNQNRRTQRIERFRKDSLSGNWVIWMVWSSNVTTTTGEQVEDNIRFLKLTFTPAINATWNGNTYNTLDPQNYVITSLGDPDTKGSLTFNETLTVSHGNDDNLVYRKFAEERYAKGAGLYYRVNEDVEKIFGTENIKSGYIYTETLLSYSITP